MSARTVWVSLVVMLATGGVVFGLGPFDALLAASPDGTTLDMVPRPESEARAWLTGLGESGRALLVDHLWWDTVFLLVHGVCSWVLLRAALSRLGPRLAPAAWICALPAGLDLAENACLVSALDSWPSAFVGAGWLEPVTAVKLQLVPLIFFAIVAAWGAVLVRSRLGRRAAQATVASPALRGGMAASR